MDGYYSVQIMARLATFAEMLSEGAESTQIERAGDASADAFTCEIFTRRNHFSLSSCGGLVRINVQSLDSHEETSELLVEVEASHERSIETLRAIVSSVEAISAMKARQDFAGLRALRRMIDQSLPITRGGQEDAPRD
jgi:hypothetical protein